MSEASQVVLAVKNCPAHAGGTGDTPLIPGLGRPPEGGMATHSSILAWRIPRTRDRGTQGAVVHGVTESDTTEAS